MDPRVLSLAERVVRRSDAAHPADAVLRLELQSARRFSPEQAREVSKLVFSYFRWRGWLDSQSGFSAQIVQAAELAARFHKDPDSFTDAELVERGLPAWLREEMQCSADFARALQREPKLWLRARSGQGRWLAQRLAHCRAFGVGALADILEYQGRADLFRTPEFHEGSFEVQDLSSQAVGLTCAPQSGQTWWDACAGEGGKLLHLADLMNNKGLIWATDRAEWRLRKLKRRAARAKTFNYRTAVWEGGSGRPTRAKFDGVLVDAPCSGIGTWQRNPHARWTLTQKDIAELASLQLKLLTHVAPALKPGGKLVYSVCSLTRAETADLAEAFEKSVAGFTPFEMTNPLNPAAPLAKHLWLWPQQFGGNGMFISAWVRTEG